MKNKIFIFTTLLMLQSYKSYALFYYAKKLSYGGVVLRDRFDNRSCRDRKSLAHSTALFRAHKLPSVTFRREALFHLRDRSNPMRFETTWTTKKNIHHLIYNNVDEKLICLLTSSRDKRILLSQFDDKGYQPLHAAVYQRNKFAVEFLLLMGADCNTLSRSGQSPLEMAADLGADEIFHYLLCYGAKVFLGEMFSVSVFAMLVKHDYVDQIKQLISSCVLYSLLEDFSQSEYYQAVRNFLKDAQYTRYYHVSNYIEINSHQGKQEFKALIAGYLRDTSVSLDVASLFQHDTAHIFYAND